MTDHERIYLQPSCCADFSIGRLWSEDPDPEECEEGVPWTEYVRADLAASSRSPGLPVINDELWEMFSETSLMTWDRKNSRPHWTQDAVDFACCLLQKPEQALLPAVPEGWKAEILKALKEAEKADDLPDWWTPGFEKVLNCLVLSAAPKVSAAPQSEEKQSCVDDDGCPTERAVLKRFWHEHQQDNE